MMVDKYTEPSVDPSAEPITTAAVDVKSKIKNSKSVKVFTHVTIGSTVIIIIDGVSRISEDPLWGITCIIVGIPIIIFSIVEIYKEPKSKPPVN
jgi:hypothetical protein